jgi:hypothetical protein
LSRILPVNQELSIALSRILPVNQESAAQFRRQVLSAVSIDPELSLLAVAQELNCFGTKDLSASVHALAVLGASSAANDSAASAPARCGWRN